MGKSRNSFFGKKAKQQLIESIVRVNHAGEYGAVRIYKGQMAILGKSPMSPLIQHMLDQERDHLKQFEKEIVSRRVRPTALLPLWHVLGYALGAGTALMGGKAAMACTVAVEEVIEKHYAGQVSALNEQKDEKKLKQLCEKFRDEELEHRDTGLDNQATEMAGYSALRKLVRAGSKVAIWLSKRI